MYMYIKIKKPFTCGEEFNHLRRSHLISNHQNCSQKNNSKKHSFNKRPYMLLSQNGTNAIIVLFYTCILASILLLY